MHSNRRRQLSVFAAALIACASLIGAAGSANAATTPETPSDLSVSLLSPHAGNTTGANLTYTSVSGWRNTNVVVTLPGWTALNPFASTGSGSARSGQGTQLWQSVEVATKIWSWPSASAKSS